MFNPMAKFVASKPNILHQFGKVSYGIYMFNPVLIYVILNAFSKFSFQNYFVFLLLVHVALVITTYLSYRFLEAPFLALKEKFSVVKSGGFESSKMVPINEDVETNPAEENEALVTIPINVREE